MPEGEWEAVGRDAHAVIDEAKAAESSRTASTSSAAASTKACRPFSSQQTEQSPRAATHGRPRGFGWLHRVDRRRAARGAHREGLPVDKSYASSGSTRSPAGG